MPVMYACVCVCVSACSLIQRHGVESHTSPAGHRTTSCRSTPRHSLQSVTGLLHSVLVSFSCVIYVHVHTTVLPPRPLNVDILCYIEYLTELALLSNWVRYYMPYRMSDFKIMILYVCGQKCQYLLQGWQVFADG